MKTRPTPETDEAIYTSERYDGEEIPGFNYVEADFTKRLEQERDEAREQAAELLEALEIITELFKCTGAKLATLNGEPTSYEKALAAIAKAKGGQP